MIHVNLTKQQSTTSSQSVYRLYNKVSGEHLYTTSNYEYNSLNTMNSGWLGEGVAWKAKPKTREKVANQINFNGFESLLFFIEEKL